MSNEPLLDSRVRLTGWRMLQAVFLMSVSTALVLTMIFAGAFIPPVMVFALIYLLLAGIVLRWRFSTRISIAAAVLAFLGLAGNAPFLMEDLAHPESWGSFIPAAMSVIAGIASVVAAVAALRATGVRLVRPVLYAVEGLTFLVIAVSLALSFTAEDADVQAGDVVVLAEAIEYPETLSMAGPGAIFIENYDRIRHTFVIKGTDIAVEVPALKSRRTEVSLPAGAYDYLCDVPGHERMEGTLTVQ